MVRLHGAIPTAPRPRPTQSSCVAPFTATATHSSRSLSITLNPPIETAGVGTQVSTTVTATGGSGTIGLTYGTLPAGLTLIFTSNNMAASARRGRPRRCDIRHLTPMLRSGSPRAGSPRPAQRSDGDHDLPAEHHLPDEAVSDDRARHQPAPCDRPMAARTPSLRARPTGSSSTRTARILMSTARAPTRPGTVLERPQPTPR